MKNNYEEVAMVLLQCHVRGCELWAGTFLGRSLLGVDSHTHYYCSSRDLPAKRLVEIALGNYGKYKALTLTTVGGRAVTWRQQPAKAEAERQQTSIWSEPFIYLFLY